MNMLYSSIAQLSFFEQFKIQDKNMIVTELGKKMSFKDIKYKVFHLLIF